MIVRRGGCATVRYKYEPFLFTAREVGTGSGRVERQANSQNPDRAHRHRWRIESLGDLTIDLAQVRADGGARGARGARRLLEGCSQSVRVRFHTYRTGTPHTSRHRPTLHIPESPSSPHLCQRHGTSRACNQARLSVGCVIGGSHAARGRPASRRPAAAAACGTARSCAGPSRAPGQG